MSLPIPDLNHGAIGNGRVLALISPTSAIEWLCLPRFDSPSVFGRILDSKNGGAFRILASDEEILGQISYIPNTNVLATRFEHQGIVWEIIDFAPRLPRGLSIHAPIQIVRILRPIHGQPKLQVDLDPRPDYARAKVRMVETSDGIEVSGNFTPITLHTNLPTSYVLGKRPFLLDRTLFFVISHGYQHHRPTLAEIQHDCDMTVNGWRAWVKTCALPTFAPEAVLRSALCLKLHVYEDTGAIIAAATTSIPEAMGTQRTWDYRYCWLRDAAFVVEALRRLSHLSERERFIHFLRDVAEAGPLQPLYGIDGERRIQEKFLPHLAGFGGNGYVRIGNAVAEQRQNNQVGELVLCLETLSMDGGLVHRYRNEDDFGLTTSAFTICSFWMSETLALMGELDEAIVMFRYLLTIMNPVGLFSEDFDPHTNHLLGNFPQAYTHVGLINAAMTIGGLIEARDGKVRAWV